MAPTAPTAPTKRAPVRFPVRKATTHLIRKTR
jgi:hypothetical protein